MTHIITAQHFSLSQPRGWETVEAIIPPEFSRWPLWLAAELGPVQPVPETANMPFTVWRLGQAAKVPEVGATFRPELYPVEAVGFFRFPRFLRGVEAYIPPEEIAGLPEWATEAG